MPKLDLTRALQIKGTFGEAASLKLPGGRVWHKTYPIDPFTIASGVVSLANYSGPLGPYTMKTGVLHGIAVEGGVARPNSATVSAFALDKDMPVNHFVQGVWKRGTGTAVTGVCLATRVSSGGYCYARFDPPSNSFLMFRQVGGTPTQIGTAANALGVLQAAGNLCDASLTSFESTHTLRVNGQVLIQATDAVITSGQPGLRNHNASAALGVGIEIDSLTIGVALAA